MTDSILDNVKKTLGLDPSYTIFDVDVMLHINSVLSTLTQLGIGPTLGFMIEDNTATWGTFIGTDLRLNSVKSYVYLNVRLLFDPPTNSFVTASMEKRIEEFAWRLNVQREGESWTDPTPPAPPTEPLWWGVY